MPDRKKKNKKNSKGLVGGIQDGLDKWSLKKQIYEHVSPNAYPMDQFINFLNGTGGGHRGNKKQIENTINSYLPLKKKIDSTWDKHKYEIIKANKEKDRLNTKFNKLRKENKNYNNETWRKKLEPVRDSIRQAETKYNNLKNEYSNKTEKLDRDVRPLSEKVRRITEGMGVTDEDMWRKFLKYKQLNNTVYPSKHKPSIAKDPNAEYFVIDEIASQNAANYYVKQHAPNEYVEPDTIPPKPNIKEVLKNNWNEIKNLWQDPKQFAKDFISYGSGKGTKGGDALKAKAKAYNEYKERKDYYSYPRVISGPTGLANMTVNKGEDKDGKFVSLYDKYDFNVPGSNLIGNEYELYNRFYYDDKDGKPVARSVNTSDFNGTSKTELKHRIEKVKKNKDTNDMIAKWAVDKTSKDVEDRMRLLQKEQGLNIK